MSAASESAAEKKAREAKEAEDAKAAAAKQDNAKDGDTKNGETETVEVSDRSNNDRLEEVDKDTAIREPEGTFISRPTAVDHAGIERVLPGNDPNWTPAPLEASDADKEAAKKREEAEDDRAKAREEGRIDPVSGKVISREEHAKNEKERKAAEKKANA